MKQEDFDWAIHTIPVWTAKFRIKRIPKWVNLDARLHNVPEFKKGEEGLFYNDFVWLPDGRQFPAKSSMLEFIRHVQVRKAWGKVPIEEVFK